MMTFGRTGQKDMMSDDSENANQRATGQQFTMEANQRVDPAPGWRLRTGTTQRDG
jgi:hypothetical protein